MLQTVGRRAVAALSRAIGAWFGFRVWHGFQMQTFGGLPGAARGWAGGAGARGGVGGVRFILTRLSRLTHRCDAAVDKSRLVACLPSSL